MSGNELMLAADGLKIDWDRMPTYNTIMSVAAGEGPATHHVAGPSPGHRRPVIAPR